MWSNLTHGHVTIILRPSSVLEKSQVSLILFSAGRPLALFSLHFCSICQLRSRLLSFLFSPSRTPSQWPHKGRTGRNGHSTFTAKSPLSSVATSASPKRAKLQVTEGEGGGALKAVLKAANGNGRQNRSLSPCAIHFQCHCRRSD